MQTNEFDAVRELLSRVRQATGDRCIIGLAWAGDFLRLSAARPDSGKKIYIATFDGADDFMVDAGGIIDQFAKCVNEYFGDSASLPETGRKCAGSMT